MPKVQDVDNFMHSDVSPECTRAL